MKTQRSRFEVLYPFLHAKPSKELLEEEAFLRAHGGKGSRAIYLAVEAISALLSAPFDMFLAAIRYEHPLKKPHSVQPPKLDNPLPVKRPRDARHHTGLSRKCPHADTCTDQTSRAQRRA